MEAERLVPEGDLPALKALLQRILGSPNNLQQNLRDAAACERAPLAATACCCCHSPLLLPKPAAAAKACCRPSATTDGPTVPAAAA